MSEHSREAPFFIGWSNHLPQGLRGFYVAVGIMILGLFSFLGIVGGSRIDDPAVNLFSSISTRVPPKPEPWLGDQRFTGTVTHRPYPILHVSAAPGARIERSILLSGSGKRGASVADTSGRIEAVGGLLRRGDIDMLVIDDSPVQTGVAEAPPKAQPMGRWRTVGEICDGKCYPGGMLPGGGLSHRACASLCLLGEVPAILVVAAPVAGADFLVLAGPDGREPPALFRDYIARPISLEGDVERLGTILIFRADPSTVKQL